MNPSPGMSPITKLTDSHASLHWQGKRVNLPRLFPALLTQTFIFIVYVDLNDEIRGSGGIDYEVPKTASDSVFRGMLLDLGGDGGGLPLSPKYEVLRRMLGDVSLFSA